jgi:hypothetical protein
MTNPDPARGAWAAAPPRPKFAVRGLAGHAASPDRVAQWSLAPRPQSVRQARNLVRRTLNAWGLDSLADDAELLVSELTTNAVRAIRYVSRSISLRLVLTDRLLCEVGDDNHALPMLCHPPPTSETGRGLDLIDHLASHWGSTPTDTGKLVWFELRLPADVSGGESRDA